MKTAAFFFSAGGAEDSSPRRQPWVEIRELLSPRWGARKPDRNDLFRPIRGWDYWRAETHGATVGYFRSLLRSFSLVLASTLVLAGNLFASDIASDFSA